MRRRGRAMSARTRCMHTPWGSVDEDECKVMHCAVNAGGGSYVAAPPPFRLSQVGVHLHEVVATAVTRVLRTRHSPRDPAIWHPCAKVLLGNYDNACSWNLLAPERPLSAQARRQTEQSRPFEEEKDRTSPASKMKTCRPDLGIHEEQADPSRSSMHPRRATRKSWWSAHRSTWRRQHWSAPRRESAATE